MEKRPQHQNAPKITFSGKEVDHPNHDDALVISTVIANAYIKRIMVDTGSSVDILYLNAFQKLGLTKKDLTPMVSTLIGFTRDSISPLGTTALSLTVVEEPRSKTLIVTFMVVGIPSTYNIILGRPTLNRIRAIISTYHRAMKFLTHAGVNEVRSDPQESRQCYLTIILLPKKVKLEASILDPREAPNRKFHPGPTEQTMEVPLH